MNQQYNPYSVEFQSGDRFEIKFKDKLIVAEGRQREVGMIRSTVDLLNAAYTFGVQDVKTQLDAVVKAQVEQIAELESRIDNMSESHAEMMNRYYELMQQNPQLTEAAGVQTPSDVVGDGVPNEVGILSVPEEQSPDKPQPKAKTNKTKGTTKKTK